MQLKMTPVVKALLIVCFGAFLIQQTADQFFGGHLLSLFGLIPYEFAVNYRFWQLFTYPFLHGDVLHLFLNLMVLAFIGTEIEAVWGKWRFVRFYSACSIAAGIFYLFLQFLVFGETGLHIPMIGASGAIYGLLIAYGLIFSERELLFMMIFPMKAKHFIWVIVAMEVMTTVFSGRGGGLSAAAHLGGMIAGFVYLWCEAMIIVARKKKAAEGGAKKSTSAKHLKLVVNKPGTRGPSDDDTTNSGQSPPTWH